MEQDGYSYIIFEVSQFERWSGLVSKIELLSTFILPKFFSVCEQLPTCGIFFYSGVLQSSHFQAINVTAYHLKRDCCGHKGPINVQTLFHCKEKWVLYTEVIICGPCHKEEKRFHTLSVDLSKVIIKNYYVSLSKFLLPNSLEPRYQGPPCSRGKSLH